MNSLNINTQNSSSNLILFLLFNNTFMGNFRSVHKNKNDTKLNIEAKKLHEIPRIPIGNHIYIL